VAAAATLRPGVQPGQLPAEVGAAEVREALVADHATGEADQDWGEGGAGTPTKPRISDRGEARA